MKTQLSDCLAVCPSTRYHPLMLAARTTTAPTCPLRSPKLGSVACSGNRSPEPKKYHKREREKGRRAGAQEGHDGARRATFPPEKVTRVVDHRPDCCEACGREILDTQMVEGNHRRQVVEIPEIVPDVTEVREPMIDRGTLMIPARPAPPRKPKNSGILSQLPCVSRDSTHVPLAMSGEGLPCSASGECPAGA